jgi:hypothetical protein
MFAITADRTFIHWDSATYGCATNTSACLGKWPSGSSTRATTETGLIRLAGTYFEFFSAILAGHYLWSFESFVSLLAPTLGRTIGLSLSAIDSRKKLFPTKPAFLSVLQFVEVICCVALVRAKASMSNSCLRHPKPASALQALNCAALSWSNIFTAEWSTHSSIVQKIDYIINTEAY